MKFNYCPHCGNKSILKEIGDEGMIPFCENCSKPLFDMFPISVIVAVSNEYKEVALLRQNYVSTKNHVCVAGYMKLGETAEEAVRREVKEELGLELMTIKYIDSYIHGEGDNAMLMLGFNGKAKKADFKLSSEVDEAEWVPLAKAPGMLREGGIAYKLVKEIVLYEDL